MKKSNSKKMIIGLFVSVATLIVLLIVASILESSDFQWGSDNRNVADSINGDTDESTTLYYVGNSEMYAILNDRSSEGFFVYIGTPTCPVCQEFEPILKETLQDLDRELRYFRTDLAREDEESEITMGEILDVLGVTHVPTLVYIKNGEAIDTLVGLHEQEVIISFFDSHGGLN